MEKCGSTRELKERPASGNLPSIFRSEALLRLAETASRAMVEIMKTPMSVGFRGVTWRLRGLKLVISTSGSTNLSATVAPLGASPSSRTEEIDVIGLLSSELKIS